MDQGTVDVAAVATFVAKAPKPKPKLLPCGTVHRLGPGPSITDIDLAVPLDVDEAGKFDFLSGWHSEEID